MWSPRVAAVALLAPVLISSVAKAGESLEELALTGALYNMNRHPTGVLFYTRGMEVKHEFEPARTELRARAKRPRTGSDHEKDCRDALYAALQDLHDQAIAKQYDVVAGLVSFWRDAVPSQPGVYTCAVGATLVAVELKGSAYRIKKAVAKPSAQATGPNPSPVVTAESPAGKTYSVLLGSTAVGAKLVATPDRAPDEVQIALAFRAKEGESPHQNCTLGVTAGTDALPVQAARYERSSAQETLFGTLAVEQLAKLAAQDGALTACETRVQVSSTTRAKISALLTAVNEHLKAHKTVQRGDSLSL